MKTYVNPEIEVVFFENEDIVTESSVLDNAIKSLTDPTKQGDNLIDY